MATSNRIVGVYQITHTPTGFFYVGSSANIPGRITHHRWALKSNRSNCRKLQEYFNKVGSFKDFNFNIMITETREEAYGLEQSILDKWAGNEKLLNICLDARSPITHHFKDPEVKNRATEGTLRRLSAQDWNTKSARARKSNATRRGGYVIDFEEVGNREFIELGYRPNTL